MIMGVIFFAFLGGACATGSFVYWYALDDRGRALQGAFYTAVMLGAAVILGLQ